MLKKVLALLAVFSVIAPQYASASFYIAPTLAYQDLSNDDLDFRGIKPSLYFGYGDWFREYLYVAGEIFISSRAYKLKDDDIVDGKRLVMGESYGFSILPTTALDSNLMAYLRLGYVRANFSGVNSKVGAYQLGIGAEMPIYNCWSLRAEYIYTPYRSVTDLGTIKSHEISLGAVYRLDSIFNGPTTL
jgi:hypothetical protein